MAAADVITDTSQEGNSNTYTIRPNFQHKYVAALKIGLTLNIVLVLGIHTIYKGRCYFPSLWTEN